MLYFFTKLAAKQNTFILGLYTMPLIAQNALITTLIYVHPIRRLRKQDFTPLIVC